MTKKTTISTPVVLFVGMIMWYLWAVGTFGGWPATLLALKNGEEISCDDVRLTRIHELEDGTGSMYANIKSIFFPDVVIPCMNSNDNTSSTSSISSTPEPDVNYQSPPWFCENRPENVEEYFDTKEMNDCGWMCQYETDDDKTMRGLYHNSKHTEHQMVSEKPLYLMPEECRLKFIIPSANLLSYGF